MTHEQHRRPETADAARRGAPTPWNGAALEDPFGGPPGPDYDALADLFLGEPENGRAAGTGPEESFAPAPANRPVLRVVSSEDEDPDAQGAAPGAWIEGLIIGHLPVLASAWVTQYARHVAGRSGEWVGLVKLRAGQASVELVGPAGTEGTPAGTARDTLDGAIGEAARVASKWLLRVDELTEARLAEMPGLDGVTLLTGVDEAAVVASYRTLKMLHDGSGEDEARLGVAIMGACPERAQEAAGKLARTVEVHLGRKLPLAACVPQIGPGRSVGLYRGGFAERTEAVVSKVIRLIRAGAERARHRAEESIAPPPPPTPAPEAQPPAKAAPPTPTRADGSGDGLARHVPGLKALPAPCPYAPGVELAVDASGRVHALARMEGPDGRVMEQLLAASAWAGAHAEWIRLASGAASGGDAVMHVFTDDPKSVRRLLDADVRMHLLARVRVGELEAWVCRDLN